MSCTHLFEGGFQVIYPPGLCHRLSRDADVVHGSTIIT